MTRLRGLPPHQWPVCQRWHHHRHTWVRRRDGGFDQSGYEVVELAEADARRYVLAHHFAASWPAARLRYGLLDLTDGSLCGVLVLGVPMHPNVLLRPFPYLEPYAQSLELVRLVVGPGVASNGESWFTTAALGMAAERGVRGVVAFADPIPRVGCTDAGPVVVMPGHCGTVYQACNARYTGLATPRRQILLPDATVLTARAAAKVTSGERGARGVIARLVDLGASAPGPGQPPSVWLAHALSAIGARTVRHPGNHRYLMRVGAPALRRRTRILLSAKAYPKRHHPEPVIAAALANGRLSTVDGRGRRSR